MSHNVICPNCGTVNSPRSRQCSNCQSPIEPKHHRFNAKDPRFWLILFVVLFVSYILGSYALDLYKENKGRQEPVAQVVPIDKLTDWHTQRLPFGVSVMLPVHLTEVQSSVSSDLAPLIDKNSSFTYIKKNLSIALTEIIYKPQVDSLSIEGALDGSMAELQSMTGTKISVNDRNIYEKDNMLFGMQVCNYADKTGDQYQRKEMIVINGSTLYNFIVCFDLKDERLQDVANKIFYSFHVHGVK